MRVGYNREQSSPRVNALERFIPAANPSAPLLRISVLGRRAWRGRIERAQQLALAWHAEGLSSGTPRFVVSYESFLTFFFHKPSVPSSAVTLIRGCSGWQKDLAGEGGRGGARLRAAARDGGALLWVPGCFHAPPPSFSAGRQPPVRSVARSRIHRWPPAALDSCPCSPWGGLGAGNGTRSGSRRVLAPPAAGRSAVGPGGAFTCVDGPHSTAVRMQDLSLSAISRFSATSGSPSPRTQPETRTLPPGGRASVLSGPHPFATRGCEDPEHPMSPWMGGPGIQRSLSSNPSP